MKVKNLMVKLIFLSLLFFNNYNLMAQSPFSEGLEIIQLTPEEKNDLRKYASNSKDKLEKALNEAKGKKLNEANSIYISVIEEVVLNSFKKEKRSELLMRMILNQTLALTSGIKAGNFEVKGVLKDSQNQGLITQMYKESINLALHYVKRDIESLDSENFLLPYNEMARKKLIQSFRWVDGIFESSISLEFLKMILNHWMSTVKHKSNLEYLALSFDILEISEALEDVDKKHETNDNKSRFLKGKINFIIEKQTDYKVKLRKEKRLPYFFGNRNSYQNQTITKNWKKGFTSHMKLKIGDFVESSPAIMNDGKIVVGSSDGNVYVLEIKDERLIEVASYQTGGNRIYASPALMEDEKIVIGSIDGSVHVLELDLKSRKLEKVASYQTEGVDSSNLKFSDAISSSPAIMKDGKIVIGSHNSNVYVLELDLKSRKLTKFASYQTKDSIIYSSPALMKDEKIVVGSSDGKVYVLEIKNEKLIEVASYQTEGSVRASPAFMKDEKIVIGSLDGNLYVLELDLESRELTKVALFETGDMIQSSSAIMEDGKIVVGSDNHYVYILSLKGQKLIEVASFKTKDSINSHPAIMNDEKIVVGSENGKVYVLKLDLDLDLESRELTKVASYQIKGIDSSNLDSYAISSSPALMKDGKIVIGSGDGYIYVLE